MHDEAPLHALMGGGDQLYNDGLWGVPSLRAWLAIEDDKACCSQALSYVLLCPAMRLSLTHATR